VVDAGSVGYAEDVDVVRDYVRTTGRSDYIRMHEVAPECIAVEFAFDVERHAVALADAVTDPKHVRVLRGRMRADQLSELGRQYWQPGEEAVFAVCDTVPNLYEISFGYDDDGPFLAVGLWPLTDAERARVTEAFKPYRVRTHQQGPTNLL
jgi:hypothetical protein